MATNHKVLFIRLKNSLVPHESAIKLDNEMEEPVDELTLHWQEKTEKIGVSSIMCCCATRTSDS